MSYRLQTPLEELHFDMQNMIYVTQVIPFETSLEYASSVCLWHMVHIWLAKFVVKVRLIIQG